jgi:hypothetical protein
MKETFNLVSFKLTDKGADVVHKEENGDLTGNDTINAKEKPHQDLIDALDELKIYYADKIGLLKGWDFAHKNCKAAAKDNCDAGRQKVLDDITMKGISFDGEGDLAGVNLKGYVQFPVKGGSGIPSGKISFNENVLGYEGEVKELALALKDEIYQYRFKGKFAPPKPKGDPDQLDLIDAIDAEDNPV